MKLSVEPGTYVVAVSGGVDSVALLNMLSNIGRLELIVTHYNHGIRKDSAKDERFVKALALSYGYKFETEHGRLGTDASEATARKSRYKFLRSIQNKYQASGIITAHHQDDIIETAIINLIRGTNRKGLSSLKSSDGLLRPLSAVTKKELISYANKHHLSWIEDPTNKDPKYLRNWVRFNLMPIINNNPKKRQEILSLIEENHKINEQINPIIATKSHNILKSVNNRQLFTMLPDNISKEVLSEIFIIHRIKNIDSKKLSLLATYIKTGAPGTVSDVKDGYKIALTRKEFELREPKV